MIRVRVGLEHIYDFFDDFAKAFENAGLRNAHGWTLDWRKMSGGWDAGTPYTPSPEGSKVEDMKQAREDEDLGVDGTEEHAAKSVCV